LQTNYLKTTTFNNIFELAIRNLVGQSLGYVPTAGPTVNLKFPKMLIIRVGSKNGQSIVLKCGVFVYRLKIVNV
jgi:hypothetical protein